MKTNLHVVIGADELNEVRSFLVDALERDASLQQVLGSILSQDVTKQIPQQDQVSSRVDSSVTVADMPDVILQGSLRQDSSQNGDVHDFSLRSGSFQVDSSSLADPLDISLPQNDTGSQGGTLTQSRMLQLCDVKTLIRCSYS